MAEAYRAANWKSEKLTFLAGDSGSNPATPVAASGTALRSRQSSSCPGNQVLCDPTWIGIKRDLLDDALVPLNADLDQNNDPEVAQRGRNLDA
jgi:hypothetical protein